MKNECVSSTSTLHHPLHVMVPLPSYALHAQNEEGLL